MLIGYARVSTHDTPAAQGERSPVSSLPSGSGVMLGDEVDVEGWKDARHAVGEG